MNFEQAKKVLQLTDARIRKFGSIDASTSHEIHDAIFKFQPFQRLVIAYHAQEALTHLREQTVPLANSLEQLIATAINLNHAEFREFAHPNMDKLLKSIIRDALALTQPAAWPGSDRSEPRPWRDRTASPAGSDTWRGSRCILSGQPRAEARGRPRALLRRSPHPC